MNDILSLSQLLCKKLFIVLYVRRLRDPVFPNGYIFQQLICPNFQFIQKAPIFSTDIIRARRNTKFLFQRYRQVAYAVRCHDKRTPLSLLKDQNVLSNLGLIGFLTQHYQFLRQNTQNSRFQQSAADRFCQIAAKSFLPIKKLIVASCIGSQCNYRRILTQSSRLHAQHMKTLYTIHLRHQVIHQDGVIMLNLSQFQAFRPA